MPLRVLVLVLLGGSENGSPNICKHASYIEENGTYLLSLTTRSIM